MPPKIVAIINMKGGVGKTTLTWNLSQHLFTSNKKVLVVDMDPQANATSLGLTDGEYAEHKKSKKTIADLFVNCYRRYGPFPKEEIKLEPKDFIFRREQSENAFLDFVPSELNLSSILKGAYVDPFLLENLLKHSFFTQYDFIFIDCAPTNSNLTTLSLNAAKDILVPIMTDTFASHGIELLQEVIEQHKEDFDVHVNIIGLVFMRWRSDKANQADFKADLVKKYGSLTFETPIRDSEWYRIANGRRVDIRHTGAHEDCTGEFAKFVEEFLERIKKTN